MRNGGDVQPVELAGAFRGTDWGRAVAELASAITEDRPHRASGEHAAHVVEIVEAIETAVAEERPVEVRSSFPRVPVPPAAAVGASGNGSGAEPVRSA